ncbi:MAG: GNAT family N-acetyltransferase, partial [Treponema sp.]|nr:GNAT family N-acetyltransferase [Treponema sp.]
MLEIRDCDNYDAAKELIVEYSKIKGAESCFVSLDKELADLGSFYEGGALLIGYEQGIPVATVALKRLGDTSAEVKRLYVKPECRGNGYARILLEELLSRCKKLGCKEVTLT